MPKPFKTKIVHLAVKPEMYQLIQAMARLEDCPVTIILRRAISSYLSTSLKQAEARQQESKTA